MESVSADSAWRSYALTGRPDFYNYVQHGDVTWPEVWEFYRRYPADTDAMVSIIGLFHMFESVQFELEGSVLDCDDGVYPALREWAKFCIDSEGYLPDDKLRNDLGGLLSQSLVSALYFEAAFNVYLETKLETHPEVGIPCDEIREWVRAVTPPVHDEHHLRARLPELPFCVLERERAFRIEALPKLHLRHYCEWNGVYQLALGADEEDWLDEGGEG
jgi:hypothetical protein